MKGEAGGQEDPRKRREREGDGRTQGGLEEVADAPDGSEDEKVEQRSDREGRFDEKKAASPGPSGA